MSEVRVATIRLNGEKQDFILNEKNFKTGSSLPATTGKAKCKWETNAIKLTSYA